MKVDRILVDLWSALSMMPKRLIKSLGTPSCRLNATQTTIYGFDSSGTHPFEKVKLKFQISDLKTEVTCFLINTETTFNLILGHPLIHCNGVAPSTLHQVTKYVREQGEIQTLIADRPPFKGAKIT